MAAILALVGLTLTIVQLLLLARVAVDWVLVLSPSHGPGTTVGHTAVLLRRLTEPILKPLRRVLPPVRMGSVSLDLSVAVAFIAIMVLRGLLGV